MQLISATPFLRDLYRLTNMSQLLNLTTDATMYGALYTQLADEYHRTWYSDVAKGYADGQQAANVLALSLPGVGYVGHTHPVSVNGILCTMHATAFARRRLFPDEVVCCGPASVLVPYTDPGLPLAQVIRRKVARYVEKRGVLPRVILLENHGIITFGASPEAVKAAMFMADKAAKIFLQAASLGGPRFLSAKDVERIANRIDEHYRQRALQI